MSPVVSLAARPLREAFREKPAIGNIRKLLQACKQSIGSDQNRAGLYQANLRVTCHLVGQGVDRTCAHQTVCIKNDHGLVGVAPTRDPVDKVAHFLVDVLGPSAIENPHTLRRLSLQCCQGLHLRLGHSLVIGIGENKQRVPVSACARSDVVKHGGCVAEDIACRFIENRQQKRNGERRAFARVAICTARASQQAGYCKPDCADRKADPDKCQTDHRQDQPFHP